MSKAKSQSSLDGRSFMRAAFAAEQEVLAVQLELSSTSITHDGVMGEVNEQHFIQFLKKYLPKRYNVDRGIVIDSNGSTSDQIDIIVFDNQYTPTLLDQQSHRYIPAEAVYAVFEVKPTINKQYLEYAGSKAASVRTLERTSVAIRSAGADVPAVPLFPIVAGIVAARTEWSEGLSGSSFSKNLIELSGSQTIDCGLSLSDVAFDVFDGELRFSTNDGALASFLFRLLDRLQALGTAPATDWKKYAGILSSD